MKKYMWKFEKKVESLFLKFWEKWKWICNEKCVIILYMYENVKRGGVKNIFTCGLWKDLKGASLAAIKKNMLQPTKKKYMWKLKKV